MDVDRVAIARNRILEFAAVQMIIFGENVFTHDSARFPNPHERRDHAHIRFLESGERVLHKPRNAVDLGAADLIRAADLKWIERIKAADARSVEREFALPSIHAEELKIAEIIFVEDDSPDGSLEKIRRLHQRYPAVVRAVSLSRRFGHQASLAAGFQVARGDVVACMDSDMQWMPSSLPPMSSAPA